MKILFRTERHAEGAGAVGLRLVLDDLAGSDKADLEEPGATVLIRGDDDVVVSGFRARHGFVEDDLGAAHAQGCRFLGIAHDGCQQVDAFRRQAPAFREGAHNSCRGAARIGTSAERREVCGDAVWVHPFGYQVGEDGRMVPVAEEQAAIIQMRRMRKQGRTYRDIAEAVQKRHAVPITHVTVMRVLSRETAGPAP